MSGPAPVHLRSVAWGDAPAPARVVSGGVDRCVGVGQDHLGRFRLLAEAGVQHVIIPVVKITTPKDVTAFSEVTAAFS